jgi:hypothetical protein
MAIQIDIASIFSRRAVRESSRGGRVEPAMRSLGLIAFLGVCALQLVASAQTVRGQEPETEAAVTPSAPVATNAWSAVRAVRDQERLELSEAWMQHLDLEERSALTLRRWGMALAFGVYAVSWGALAIGNADENGPLAATLAASGAAAVSLGFLTGSALASDTETWNSVSLWGHILELGMFAAAAGVASGRDGCNRDCPTFFAGLGAGSAAQALGFLAIALMTQPVFVSEHYPHYQSLPTSQRTQFALELLSTQESQQRKAQYLLFSGATLNALTWVIAATQAESRDARIAMFALAGVTLVGAAVQLLIARLEPTPSEQLSLGRPPPKPEGF